jgi:hypothetical protein
MPLFRILLRYSGDPLTFGELHWLNTASSSEDGQESGDIPIRAVLQSVSDGTDRSLLRLGRFTLRDGYPLVRTPGAPQILFARWSWVENCGPSRDSNTELPEVLNVSQSAYRAHYPVFVTKTCTTIGVCSSIILNHSKCQLTSESRRNITFILWVIRQILTKRDTSFVLYESSINVVGKWLGYRPTQISVTDSASGVSLPHGDKTDS